jgi:cellulose synthase/poly-beta-1,6-N-acetylglucosamine synthase-like glycosyltransferase/tetratricopeptide (TPR) repeat protein
MIHQKYRQFVILLTYAVCLFYLTYRLLFTLNLTTPFSSFVSVMLYLGEFYGVFVLGLFFLQVWDSREPPQQPVLQARTVDVFVPTYNEDPQLLRATLEACSRLDYPHRTYLCDDGGTEARLNDPEKGPAAHARAQVLRKMCAELNATYMPRPDNRHAKAGNLNHAFEKTDGEFIIILDADHVPEPQFISRLIGYFADDKLGFVQTPHAFYNFDSFQARLDHKNRRYWEEGHLFYEVIQPGRNRWNCPIFAGSAAMFRRQALKEVGYIAIETITEDMHTGMRVNSRGWKSLAISERLVAGQAAPDITTFHSQRIRWGEGNLSIMAHDNPLTMKGLTFAQRFCYLGSMVHWAGGLFKLAVYLTPILMMFTGVPPVAEFTWALGIVTLIYLVASIWGVRVASNGYGSFFNGELFCMVNFWTQIQGTMRALFLRKFQKFIVTSKRGRQAKTIWPFVRPQLALLGLSALALFWGWYKVLTGISDDSFKPIIPTFWMLFHTLLALIVLRRALWPEDRRFSTRHFVNLPVSYQTLGLDADGNAVGGTPVSGFGVTVDLNEIGVGLIAYEPLPVGTLVCLTLRGAGEVVDCQGEIRGVKNLIRGTGNGPVQAGGYRHGIAFRDLSPQQTDILNRMTLHYAVPRLYSEYAQGKQRTLGRRLAGWLAQGLVVRRAAQRRQVHLPLVLESDQLPGSVAYSVTEDISRTAMSTLLMTAPAPGALIDFRLPTPLGETRGRARFLRAEPRRYAAQHYQLCVLEFVHFADQDRVTLEMVLNPREYPHLGPVLEPDREPLAVPIARAVGVGLAAACAMVLVGLGCFRYLYRDDFFLRDIAVAERPITEEEIDRLESIFNATVGQNYPSTDRLVLLMGAMARVNRPREVDQVTMLLAPRDRRNLDLQFALAQILDSSKDYPRAEAEYQHLLKQLEDGTLPASRKRKLLLAAARASVHAGNLDRASERFGELLRTFPGDAAIRNEFAGVMMGAGKFAKAAQLYQGMEPDLNGRLLLVAIHTQARNFAAAERECRKIVRLHPGDVQAKVLLADVLSWKKGGYQQSRAIYEQLLKVNAGNPDLLIRLAQIALWNRHYDEALERFQALVDRRLDNAEIVRGYVDAAASAKHVGAAQRRTALAIYERVLTGTADDVQLLTRLAWILQRVEEMDKSAILLDRAVELDPKDPATRRQLLGSLLGSGRFNDKLKQFDDKELDFDTHQILVHVYLRHNSFDAATAQCRRMLELRPNDLGTLRQLADILSWNKKYKESLQLFGRLAMMMPDDPMIPVRQAEVALWSGDHDGALARFQALLESQFDSKLWPGYAAAAANAKKLNAGHHRMLLRIYDGTGAEDSQDAVFLARLAWALYRLKEGDRSRVVLDRALALRPEEPGARKELAGVLAAVGKNKEALQLYEGLTLNLTDRYRLAVLYAAEKDFAAAEKQCRAILKEKPTDRPARRQLADVLSWKKDFPQALTLLERLARDYPQDAELPVRLAEVALWSGAYDRALAGFQALLQARFDQPKLWTGFVDAASSASRLNDRQAAMIVRIQDQLTAQKTTDVVQLTRLAWVMQRLKKKTRAGVLLDRAVALQPKQPAARKELAGVLVTAGRSTEALRLYVGVPLDLADRYRLADLHAACKDFTAAAQQLREILKAKPGDLKALRQLADVLSWHKDYREARTLLEKLAHAHPEDAGLAVRLAEVVLWSGDHDGALARFQALLETRFDQPKLWRGFVDAAASASKLTEAQAALARRICGSAVGTSQDAMFLARLAWVMQRLKDTDRAVAMLDRAVVLQPREPAARKELAGILAAAGKTRAALEMYKGLNLDLADRFRLAALYAADKDYLAAEKQCLAILQDKPKDRKTLRLLAAVLSWKKDYPGALALLKQLAGEDSADVELQVRLAEVMVWSGDYEQALPRLEGLLVARFEQPDLWASFVNAAASAPGLTRAQAGLAVRIYERTAAAKCTDVAFLARLAWLLHRAKEAVKAGKLLDRALALGPQDPGVRRELAGTLALVGRFKAALTMYQGVKLDLADRYHLVGVYATALQQARAILEDQPDDEEAKRLMAYVQSWQLVVRDSLALVEKLAREAPKDRRLQVRLAEMTLWSGDFDKALGYFQGILEDQFEQPELWRSYIDAAASSTVALTKAHRRMAVRLYDLRSALEFRVEYLCRLAWVFHRLREVPKVNALLDRALALRPTEGVARKELAGMLAAAGRHRQARTLYAGLKLTLGDRYRLVEIDIACEEFDSAEKQVQAILKVKPDDLKSRFLLAQVLSGRKRFAEAAKVYRDMLRDHPNDPTVRIKIAELALWGGDYDNAVNTFQRLLDRNMQQPALWKGYVDAAASASKLPGTAHRTLVYIFDKPRQSELEEPVFLTRLAWVLRRVQEPAKAVVLLEKVLGLEPTNRRIRLQLAETLYEMGSYQQAEKHFKVLLRK